MRDIRSQLFGSGACTDFTIEIRAGAAPLRLFVDCEELQARDDTGKAARGILFTSIKV